MTHSLKMMLCLVIALLLAGPAVAVEQVFDITDVTVDGVVDATESTNGTLFDRFGNVTAAAGPSKVEDGFIITFDSAQGFLTHPLDGGAVLATGGVKTFAAGDVIDSSLTFTTFSFATIGPTGDAASFQADERGFIGLEYNLSGNTHYGWAEITQVGDGSVIVHQYGYNDTAGAASTIIPEPATLALLGLGAMAMIRRKAR